MGCGKTEVVRFHAHARSRFYNIYTCYRRSRFPITQPSGGSATRQLILSSKRARSAAAAKLCTAKKRVSVWVCAALITHAPQCVHACVSAQCRRKPPHNCGRGRGGCRKLIKNFSRTLLTRVTEHARLDAFF